MVGGLAGPWCKGLCTWLVQVPILVLLPCHRQAPCAVLSCMHPGRCVPLHASHWGCVPWGCSPQMGTRIHRSPHRSHMCNSRRGCRSACVCWCGWTFSCRPPWLAIVAVAVAGMAAVVAKGVIVAVVGGEGGHHTWAHSKHGWSLCLEVSSPAFLPSWCIACYLGRDLLECWVGPSWVRGLSHDLIKRLLWWGHLLGLHHHQGCQLVL